MKTIGEILRSERLRKNYSISEIASFIKLKEKFVVAIENNDFSSFSGEVFALGHIQNYAEFVGLSAIEIIPFFRRTWEFSKSKSSTQNKEKDNPLVLNSKIEAVGRNISKIILVSGMSLIIIFFIGFLILQYERNIIHPKLEIVYPSSDTTTSLKKITIKGQTDKDDIVFINNEEVTVGEDGVFKFSTDLNPGLNKFVIRAVNSYQKQTQVERLVLRK